MSDVSKKVFSIEPEPHEEPIALVPDPVEDSRDTEPNPPPVEAGEIRVRPIIELVEDIETDALPQDNAPDEPEPPFRPVIRSIIDPPAPISDPAEPKPAGDPVISRVMTPQPQETLLAPDQTASAIPAWGAWLLSGLLVLGVVGLASVYIAEAGSVSAVGLAALSATLVSAALLPFALFSLLKGANALRGESHRLASLADRLSRVDDAVSEDVSRLSDAIRRELAGVDDRLSRTRSELQTLVDDIATQGDALDRLSSRLSERSGLIARATGEQNDSFRALGAELETRLTELSETLDRHGEALSAASDTASERAESATAAMEHATRLTREHAEEIGRTASGAAASLTEAEGRLSALAENVAAQTRELDGFLEKRVELLSSLSDRLATEAPSAEHALHAQTAAISAVDAQIEITEGRLKDLLDHARSFQESLTLRLDDIDGTLSKADKRSRDFTADISDRVSDSVAQTRRELSMMERDLHDLQTRLKETTDALPAAKTESRPESDLAEPAAFVDELSIPEALSGEDPLDLTEALPEIPDVVRRPGNDRPYGKAFGRRAEDRAGKDWRWRDMLGSIDPILDDPILEDAAAPDAAPPPLRPPSSIDRPGPGIPLAVPRTPNVPTASRPDGSDVVARLCEVELAPSSIVSQNLIASAVRARMAGGETAQSQHLFDRLDAPILHLRGVLAADLEFRLRAEGFRRSYDTFLSGLRDASALQAELSTAAGRAYLLCAAALSS